MLPEILTIENDAWQVGVSPEIGGTLTHGRVRHGGRWVDVLRPTPDEDLRLAPLSASYPLVPWSNRIRDGLLNWRGAQHRMRPWPGQPNAMHGTGFEFPWEVLSSGPTSVELRLESSPLVGANFPWVFTAEMTYSLDGPKLEVAMAVTNVGDEPFPAGLGHHPYFRRALTERGDARLQLNCERVYPVEGMLVVGPAAPVADHLDFAAEREIGNAFVDDCFTGRTSTALGTVTYPDGVRLTMHASPEFSHSVVYIPPGMSYFAFEPVTHANDSFNLTDAGTDGQLGTVELGAGETLAASFSLEFDEPV